MIPVLLVLPIHAASDEEAQLLQWLLREQGLLEKIQHLAARLQAKVVVSTSLPFMEELCRDNGFTCRTVLVDTAIEPQSSFFGLIATAKDIEQAPCECSACFFLNWRNAACVADLAEEIESALKGAGEKGLVSVVEVEDHPVQFMRMFELLALELLVRVDGDCPPLLGRKCTRPFAFDLSSIASEECYSARELELRQIGSCMQLRPVKGTTEQRISLAEQGGLYLRTGGSSLRRVVPQEFSSAGAISAFGAPALGRAKLLADHPKGWDLYLSLELADTQPEVCVLGLHQGVSAPRAFSTSSPKQPEALRKRARPDLCRPLCAHLLFKRARYPGGDDRPRRERHQCGIFTSL